MQPESSSDNPESHATRVTPARPHPTGPSPEPAAPETLALVRRLMAEESRKRSQLQKQIDHLEAKAEKAVRDFYRLEAELQSYRRPWLVRAVHKALRMAGAVYQSVRMRMP